MSKTAAPASLSPTLLARKGGAKPAMRPQLQPLSEFHDGVARRMEDLGWNDMGDADEEPVVSAQVVALDGRELEAPRPVVKREHAPRRSAISDGRRAAFTLRIEADRHLQLRLASAVTGRSAQQLLTDALEEMLDAMPEVRDVAATITSKRN